jgi:hypothetical protein
MAYTVITATQGVRALCIWIQILPLNNRRPGSLRLFGVALALLDLDLAIAQVKQFKILL